MRYSTLITPTAFVIAVLALADVTQALPMTTTDGSNPPASITQKTRAMFSNRFGRHQRQASLPHATDSSAFSRSPSPPAGPYSGRSRSSSFSSTSDSDSDYAFGAPTIPTRRRPSRLSSIDSYYSPEGDPELSPTSNFPSAGRPQVYAPPVGRKPEHQGGAII